MDKLPDLVRHLCRLLGQVPKGRVATYGALAAALGDPAAARWVGHFLLHHDHDASCPCHRVVRSDGQLGQCEGRVLGSALRATTGSRRPLFVSPGHRVSVATAELVVRRLLHGRRLPEPLFWADRLSRAAGRGAT